MPSFLGEFEADTGLVFRDKSLLERALTHRSYLNERPEFPQFDNERLEFLGDAVLDFLVGEYVYHRLPEVREGELTSLRAALVRTETLASFARRLHLGHYLRMGHGEAESGGRERSATLCGAFEALVGALYLDQGMVRIRHLMEPFLEPELERIQQYALSKDPKSRLQEWSQGYRGVTPEYRTVEQRGPDHARVFVVEVWLGDQMYGRGEGRSKQAAAQAAATAALARAEMDELASLALLGGNEELLVSSEEDDPSAVRDVPIGQDI
ncbi:MAG: ribonuclease III [Anaerolineae bacterium]|nr:ribonuclease III [Anaerolineae bacterium]